MRECFVAIKDGADKDRIEKEIKEMPNYFAEYETIVNFTTEEEVKKMQQKLSHGGFVIRSGNTTDENAQLLENIKELGIEQLNNDPTKILLKGGYELSDKLFNKYNIEDERTNEKTTMLLCGIGTDKAKFEKLKKALRNFIF